MEIGDKDKYIYQGTCVTIFLHDKWYIRWYKRIKYFFTNGEKMLLINTFKI